MSGWKDVTLGQMYRRVIPSRTATGADGAMTGTATFLVWRDGGLTQRSSSAGITLTKSFDGITGLNLLEIDTADPADAGFYRRGSHYTYRATALTVDGIAVSIVGEFGIEHDHETGRLTVGELMTGIDADAGQLPAGVSTISNELVGQAVQELQYGQTRVLLTSDPTTQLVQFDAALSQVPTDPTRLKRFAGTPSYIEPGASDLTSAALVALSTQLDNDGVNVKRITSAATTLIRAEIDTTSTQLAAIKAKTDPLPADVSSQTSLTAVSAQVTTVNNSVNSVKAKTDNLTFTAAGTVDANVQKINDADVTGGGVGVPWGKA